MILSISDIATSVLLFMFSIDKCKMVDIMTPHKGVWVVLFDSEEKGFDLDGSDKWSEMVTESFSIP